MTDQASQGDFAAGERADPQGATRDFAEGEEEHRPGAPRDFAEGEEEHRPGAPARLRGGPGARAGRRGMIGSAVEAPAKGPALDADALRHLDASWRAANYLSVSARFCPSPRSRTCSASCRSRSSSSSSSSH